MITVISYMITGLLGCISQTAPIMMKRTGSEALLHACIKGLLLPQATHQPALPSSQLQNFISSQFLLLSIAGTWGLFIQEPLGSDIIEQQGTLPRSHCDDVLIEAH